MDTKRIRVIFFGTPQFAAVSLRALLRSDRFEVKAVVTQTDKPSGRGKKVLPSPVKQCALESTIPVLQPASIRKSVIEFMEQAGKFGPFDIGVVAAFGQILPEAVLNLPIRGCVNVHASLLPRWRGAAPIQRALMAGDRRTGVCLMQMEAGLDTGPVFARRDVPVAVSDNFATLHDRLASTAADLLIAELSRISNGEYPASPQPEAGVTYAKKLAKEEEEIDWSRQPEEVRNLVRALSPFPGAYTIVNGKRLKILDAEAIEEPALTSSEGGVIDTLDKRTLAISCGTGSLSIKTVQPEGKRTMAVAEWLAGAGLRTGMRVGRE